MLLLSCLSKVLDVEAKSLDPYAQGLQELQHILGL